jgi:hypothetical protein
MAASSGGGLRSTFAGIGITQLKDSERQNVVLGNVLDQGPTLIRADAFGPLPLTSSICLLLSEPHLTCLPTQAINLTIRVDFVLKPSPGSFE